jgi:hypothetical protein
VKRIVLLLALVMLVTACGRIHHDVAGSGIRQKQKREVPAFTSIATSGSFDIEVVCQKSQSLQVEGDDNILPLVSTEVSNNVLRIENVRGYSVNQPVEIKISVQNLDGLRSSGSGKIVISDLKNEKFQLDANGAPTVKVSGETKLVEIDASGAGKIDTHKLRAERAVVDSKGVSKIEVHATQQLDVEVSGPSHVIYQGDPVVKKTVNGPGSVEKKVSEGA